MITFSQIHQVSDEIARRFQPERIILFGSYAYGTPNEDSDVDLLVVMPLPNKGRGGLRTSECIWSLPFHLILLCAPEYLEQRITMNDFFLSEFTEKRKPLYAGDYPARGG